MSFLVADEHSKRAYAVAGKSIFYYDGEGDPAGALVGTLEREPNQVQVPFGEDQLALSFWDMGLACYGVKDGLVRWLFKDVPRVARIVFADDTKNYFAKSEDDLSTVRCNWIGEVLSWERDEEVSAAFDLGRFLLRTNPKGDWCVTSSADGSIVTTGGTRLEQPVLGATGRHGLLAISQFKGIVGVFDMTSSERLFQLDRRNWFGVCSCVGTNDPARFRALVSDWDGKAVGAVIEIDVSLERYRLLGTSANWNWDSMLLDHGNAVVRFFDDPPNRFVITQI